VSGQRIWLSASSQHWLSCIKISQLGTRHTCYAAEATGQVLTSREKWWCQESKNRLIARDSRKRSAMFDGIPVQRNSVRSDQSSSRIVYCSSTIQILPRKPKKPSCWLSALQDSGFKKRLTNVSPFVLVVIGSSLSRVGPKT
jgi:hypothetical protein